MEIQNRKELIKVLRNKVRSGWSSRSELLAYAFLREKPYVKLEARINEEKIPESNSSRKYQTGLFCFLHGLAWSTARAIDNDADIESQKSITEEVYKWILKKYPEPKSSEESAA